MKKVITILMALAIGVIVIAPTTQAEAQVISNRCCDGNVVIRCIISPPGVLGGACWCNGQGQGYIC